MAVNINRAVNLLSRAWGKQEGYAFFPYIDRQAQRETGIRNAGYHEGPNRPRGDERGASFKWPEDRPEITTYLKEHLDKGHDVYWCPSLFEYPNRRSDLAMDEHALWADLDEVDPRELDTKWELQPTIAWETSPNHWQALWLAEEGDFQGASWPGNENQRLTYMIGADPSGWDTTQLLRIPGWPNHKPDKVDSNGGKPPPGKILFSTGPTYSVTDFRELPEVEGLGSYNSVMMEAFELDVESIDRLKALAKYKIKLNYTAREMLKAKEVTGDRSSQMYYLMRCFADAGASATEIVAIIRPLVWNKFDGRADEMKRLHTEASKAVASRSEETMEVLEDEEKRKTPQRLGELLQNIQKPDWLIEGVLTEGACGFIAGEPKTYKSWVGYDLAQSIATGADFLGHFKVRQAGPVLYIQEEDPLPTLKSRGHKIWAGKAVDRMALAPAGEKGVYWEPPMADRMFDPDINAYVQQGVTISDEAWQLWLDETLELGMTPKGGTEPIPYKTVIIDTLMMTAGEVDENRAQEMTTKIFRPLKVLSRKHNVAVIVVHHLNKGENRRSGQRMLGSVANHAWGEDSMYLTHGNKKGEVKMEFESKTAPGQTYRISNLDNRGWDPMITEWDSNEEVNRNGHGSIVRSSRPSRSKGATSKKQGSSSGSRGNGQRVIDALAELGGVQTPKAIADHLNVAQRTVYSYLRQAGDKVVKTERGWTLQ